MIPENGNFLYQKIIYYINNYPNTKTVPSSASLSHIYKHHPCKCQLGRAYCFLELGPYETLTCQTTHLKKHGSDVTIRRITRGIIQTRLNYVGLIVLLLITGNKPTNLSGCPWTPTVAYENVVSYDIHWEEIFYMKNIGRKCFI